MGMLRQTKKPAMIALSFGFFTASSRRGPARRDSKLPTAFSRNPNDARMAMQLLRDNEPGYHIIAENRTPISQCHAQLLEFHCEAEQRKTTKL